uniref:Uncharacterized protein 1A n=1 Tax=Sorghum bicolor TaxID=4558 RepID=Q84YG2_SORBI|nr:hypothetical protein [Sorghum bicolor]
MEGSAFSRLVRRRCWNTTQENGRTGDGEMLNRTGTDIAVLDSSFGGCAGRRQTPARGGSGGSGGGAVTATQPAAEEGEADTLVGLVGCGREVSEELLRMLVES